MQHRGPAGNCPFAVRQRSDVTGQAGHLSHPSAAGASHGWSGRRYETVLADAPSGFVIGPLSAGDGPHGASADAHPAGYLPLREFPIAQETLDFIHNR